MKATARLCTSPLFERALIGEYALELCDVLIGKVVERVSVEHESVYLDRILLLLLVFKNLLLETWMWKTLEQDKFGRV